MTIINNENKLYSLAGIKNETYEYPMNMNLGLFFTTRLIQLGRYLDSDQIWFTPSVRILDQYKDSSLGITIKNSRTGNIDFDYWWAEIHD